MKTIKTLLLIAIMSIISASCSKTANTTNNNNSTSSGGGGGGGGGSVDGKFIAEPGNYLAYVYNSSGQEIDLGTLSANGIALTHGSSFQYTYFPTYPQTLSGATHWVCSGNTNTGVSAINYTSKPIVQVPNISAIDISKAAGYTLSVGALSADTITYMLEIMSTGTKIIKKHLGSSNGVTFTSSELSPLSVTSAPNFEKCLIVISTTNASASVFGGKNYQFLSLADNNVQVNVTN